MTRWEYFLESFAVIPVKHLLYFYIIVAVIYGLFYALENFIPLINESKFKVYKEYLGIKIKIIIIILLFIISSILMPLIVITDLIKQGITLFKNTKEELVRPKKVLTNKKGEK